MMKLKNWPILVGVLLLTACADDGLQDLRDFVKTAHADKKPRVEDLPEVKTHEVFAYASAEGVDPFEPFNLRPSGAKKVRKALPEHLTRRKEALEQYPLDALKMVGTLSRRNESWVIIQAPDGTVHRARIGNYLGQNFGKIVRILEDKVDLVETIQDPLGEWITRNASVSTEE